MASKALWRFSKSILQDIYPKSKDSLNGNNIPLDLLIFTTSFLCHVKVVYYDNNQIEKILKYFNKKLHGDIFTWYKNSDQVRWHDIYVNGKRDGILREWYESGYLAYEHSYKNEVLDGVSKGYWSNGNIRWIVNNVKGDRHGEDKEWWENGQLRKKTDFYYEKIHGHVIQWDESGKVIVHETWKNNEFISDNL